MQYWQSGKWLYIRKVVDMNNVQRFKILALSSVLLCSICSLPVHAQEEVAETQEINDSSERLNSLELRVEELSQIVADIKTSLEEIQTNEQLDEDYRISISAKLDTVSTALTSMLENDILIIQNEADKQTTEEAFHTSVLDYLWEDIEVTKKLLNTSLEQKETTVSGNSAIMTTLENNAESNQADNDNLLQGIAIVAGVMIGCFATTVLFKRFK